MSVFWFLLDHLNNLDLPPSLFCDSPLSKIRSLYFRLPLFSLRFKTMSVIYRSVSSLSLYRLTRSPSTVTSIFVVQLATETNLHSLFNRPPKHNWPPYLFVQQKPTLERRLPKCNPRCSSLNQNPLQNDDYRNVKPTLFVVQPKPTLMIKSIQTQ